MAFKSRKSSARIKYIVKDDDAVECTDEEFSQYQETLDESHLNLKEGCEPTRFLLNPMMDYESRKQLASEKYVIDPSTQKARFNLGTSYEEVRRCLVGIENPESLPKEDHIPFLKEIDGYASKSLIASFGDEIVMEMWGILQKKTPKEEQKVEELKNA